MNINRIWFILLLTLIVLVVIFFDAITPYFNSKGADDLTLADTAKVQRIDIAGADSIILERTAQHWQLNGKYQVNPVTVNNFLFAFRNIEVKGIARELITEPEKKINLKIHQEDKVKNLQFYVAGEAEFLKFKEGEQFFDVGIQNRPDVELSNIIVDKTDHWRKKSLMDLSPDEILRIKGIPPEEWGSPFIIEQHDGNFVLQNANGEKLDPEQVDEEKLLMYSSYFSDIYFDSTLTKSSGIRKVLQSEPLYILEVKDRSGRDYYLEIYSVSNEEHGKDLFHAYVRFNNSDELYLTRYFFLDLLMQTLEHFRDE